MTIARPSGLTFASHRSSRQAALAFHFGGWKQIQFSEQVQNAALFMALDILDQGVSYRSLLGAMAADAYSLVDQFVIQSEIGCHGNSLLRSFFHTR